MKLTIDRGAGILHAGDETIPLYSRRAFEIVSREWLRLCWNAKYTYTFSWMGRPMIQLPEDMLHLQEVIWQVEPDVIVETGVAHGGSLVYHATLCHARGKGRVIGVDLEIRPHNRKAIEDHVLSRYITLVEGDSVSDETVERVRAAIGQNERVLVILDSNHTKSHVRRELDAYHRMVTTGSYIVATDGIMEDVFDAPRGQPGWRTDNPAAAAREFAAEHSEFRLEDPTWPFNESDLERPVTHWPAAYLRRT
jgi:cephalosporin hydroxylase